MLKNTFIHIQGVGTRTESSLWRRGILTWEGFLSQSGVVLSQSRDPLVREELQRSLKNIRNIEYFNEKLKSSETWRLYDSFKHTAVYLDIETSGSYMGMDEITVIGLYDGGRVRTFINGVDLNDFEIAIAEYDLVVTFNGGAFDLPFIRRSFPGITLPATHIDLRFLLKRLGYSGGLKTIEKTLGLAREDGIQGLNGWDAVLLWQAHCNGDGSALDRLVRYNTADIVNLRPLMEMAFQRMAALCLPDLYA